MYYLKDGEKKLPIEHDNVFTQCGQCGKEMQIDLADAVINGDLDLCGLTWFCPECKP